MQYIQFCQKILGAFKKSQSILNLIITLASDGKANSPTELANNPLYNFKYSSISSAVNLVFEKPEQATSVEILSKRLGKDREYLKIFKDFLPGKFNNKFHQLNTDASSIYREHSPTLEDKSFVYKANEIIYGNKPVTIGYSVSCVGLNARENNVSWNLPLSCLRIPTNCNTNEFTAKQVKNLVLTEGVFGNDLVVNSSDSAYCNVNYVYPLYPVDNLVNIIRMRSNRNVYFPYSGEQSANGANKKYGNLFKLNDNKTHTEPSEQGGFTITLHSGKLCTVKMKKWDNLIISGKNDRKMYDKPFHLISVDVYDLETKNKIFKRTMWLAVWGQRKEGLSLSDIYHSYRLRFDIEFFFRFGKQKLLLDKFQTPDVEHQENWFIIVMFSYWLLYLNRYSGEIIINDWEKYLERYKNKENKEQKNSIPKTPTMAQRAMSGIISGFVKTTIIPKTRNNTTGRKKGQNQVPRERHPVVKKSKIKKNQKEIPT